MPAYRRKRFSAARRSTTKTSIRVRGMLFGSFFGEALLRVDGKRLEPIRYNREADTVKE